MRSTFTSLSFLILLTVFGLMGSYPSLAREDKYQGSLWDRLVGNTVYYKEAGVALTGLIDRKEYTPEQRAANPDWIARVEGLLDEMGPAKVLNMWNKSRFVYPGTVLNWDFTVDTGRRDINGAVIDIHQSLVTGQWLELLMDKKQTTGIVSVDCDNLPDRRLTKFRFYAVPKTGKDLDDYAYEQIYKVGPPKVRLARSGEVPDARVIVNPEVPVTSPTVLPAPCSTPTSTPSVTPTAAPSPQATPMLATARGMTQPVVTPTTAATQNTGSLRVVLPDRRNVCVVVYDVNNNRHILPAVNGAAFFTNLPSGSFRLTLTPPGVFGGQGLVMTAGDLRKTIVTGQTIEVRPYILGGGK